MPRAIWNDKVIAESQATVEVEGNQYFPPASLKHEYFQDSASHTSCPWKGTASYYDLEVDGQRNEGAAWYYPDPKPEAANIKGHVAFMRGVEIQP